MPYFIRVSDYNHIEEDIKRGFSSYMGEFDLEDVAMQLNIDTVYNDNWEQETLEELSDNDWYQYSDGFYRQKHHDGLSCHLIGDTLNEELVKKILKDSEIGYGNNHEAMWGNVQWVASIDEITHIFWADEYCGMG